MSANLSKLFGQPVKPSVKAVERLKRIGAVDTRGVRTYLGREGVTVYLPAERENELRSLAILQVFDDATRSDGKLRGWKNGTAVTIDRRDFESFFGRCEPLNGG